MITDNLKEMQELLVSLHPQNSSSSMYRESGFLYRFYEFNEDLNSSNIELSVDDMKELGEESLVSLYEYGFTINGSGSDRVPVSKEAIFIECDNDADSIGASLNGAYSKLSRTRDNIIVLFFTDAFEAVYNVDLHKIAEDFKLFAIHFNIRIYTFDLVNEVCGDRYAVKCLGSNGYTDFNQLFIPVSNNDDLKELESRVSNRGRYVVKSSLSSKLIPRDLWVISYIALRKNAVFVFEDNSFDVEYSSICQRLFSHEWGMLSDLLKHVSSLEGKSYIIKTDTNKYKPCVVTRVEQMLEFSVIALKDIYNMNLSDVVLRHTVRKKDMIVTVNDIADSGAVMNKLWTMCGKDIKAYLKLLRRVHMLCLYNLTNRLMGINQVCWIIDNGEIYFGVPAIKYNNIEVRVFTGNDERTITVNQSDLLPKTLFVDELMSDEINGTGLASIRDLSFESISNILNYRSEGGDNFTLLMSEGKIYEAFTLLNYSITEEDNQTYSKCIQMFGKEFCDKLVIELDGKFERYVNLSPLM